MCKDFLFLNYLKSLCFNLFFTNIRSIIKNMARKLSPNTINKLKKKLLAEREQLVSMLEQHQQERENIRLFIIFTLSFLCHDNVFILY